MTKRADHRPRRVERVQTGVRIERRMLKTLKGLAEYLDMTLGDLLEGIVLHAFEGKAPFRDETLRRIEQLRDIYGLDLTMADAHRMTEDEEVESDEDDEDKATEETR